MFLALAFAVNISKGLHSENTAASEVVPSSAGSVLETGVQCGVPADHLQDPAAGT